MRQPSRCPPRRSPLLVAPVAITFLSLASCAATGQEVGAGEALRQIPQEKLPPRTALPPDPAKEQYCRGKVLVRVAEKVLPKDRPAYTPEVPVFQNYLAQYLRRAGFEVLADGAGWEHRIEGTLEMRFLKIIEFQGMDIAHTYEGNLQLGIWGKAPEGKEEDRLDVPGFLKDGVQSPGVPEDQLAVLEMRRHLAKIAWDRLSTTGKTLADPEIPGLLASLAADDMEREAPVQGDAVVKALAAKRLAAVPYLLGALGDERQVRVNARYPGLTALNSDKLKVYHLADKALEEIFQKVSRMELETPAKLRFVIIRGWENEWRRFCPSFRESPDRPPAPRAPGKDGTK